MGKIAELVSRFARRKSDRIHATQSVVFVHTNTGGISLYEVNGQLMSVDNNGIVFSGAERPNHIATLQHHLKQEQAASNEWRRQHGYPAQPDAISLPLRPWFEGTELAQKIYAETQVSS